MAGESTGGHACFIVGMECRRARRAPRHDDAAWSKRGGAPASHCVRRRQSLFLAAHNCTRCSVRRREGGNQLLGRGGYPASHGMKPKRRRHQHQGPGVDGISNTVHPWFVSGRYIENVRSRSGRQRTRSSLTRCQEGTGARELVSWMPPAPWRRPQAQVRRTSDL